MAYIKHIINLTEDERNQLTKIIKTGIMLVKAIMRANIFLDCLMTFICLFFYL